MRMQPQGPSPALMEMPLSQPYQASEHLRSYNTLERGAHGQSQLWQQQHPQGI